MTIEEIISVNEKLIYKIASKFYNYDKDDLFQVGVIGLIKAYNNFDETSNTKFTTYAYEYIYGEMYALVNSSRTIKLNKDILKLYKKIEQTKYLLAQKLGHIPSIKELSLYLEIDINVLNATIVSAQSILSLDAETKEEVDLYNKLSTKENISLDDKLALKDSFKVLNNTEKKIIDFRYYKNMTQQETAKKMNITQVMVSRYEKKGLNKMYNYLAS